jgi:hypothetical protein
MSYQIPGEVNPFEAPRAQIGGPAGYEDAIDGDAETIRREHIGHEANVKSVGHLNYLGAFFGGLGTLGLVLMAAGVIPPNGNPNGMDPTTAKFIFAGVAVFYGLMTALYGSLGYGLTHLQTWARWTMVVLISLGLIYVLFVTVVLMLTTPVVGVVVLVVGGGINGFILWLLVSRKGGVVFSREYKEVIRKTPHVKLKTSIIVKILLVVILLVVVGALLSGFIGGMRN